MKTEQEALLLRVFVGEQDKYKGKPLYYAIVHAALDHGLARASAVRGIYGYGADGRIHSGHIAIIIEDLPMIVEMVDTPEKIESFLPVLDEMIETGIVMTEKVQARIYRKEKDKKAV